MLPAAPVVGALKLAPAAPLPLTATTLLPTLLLVTDKLPPLSVTVAWVPSCAVRYDARVVELVKFVPCVAVTAALLPIWKTSLSPAPTPAMSASVAEVVDSVAAVRPVVENVLLVTWVVSAATVPVPVMAVKLSVPVEACCACWAVDNACCSRLVMPVRPLVAALMVCELWPIWSSRALSALALLVSDCEVK